MCLVITQITWKDHLGWSFVIFGLVCPSIWKGDSHRAIKNCWQWYLEISYCSIHWHSTLDHKLQYYLVMHCIQQLLPCTLTQNSNYCNSTFQHNLHPSTLCHINGRQTCIANIRVQSCIIYKCSWGTQCSQTSTCNWSLKKNLHTVFLRDRAIAGICIAFREGPQKNGERANLALYFYNAACRLNPGIAF